jgi:hypothetical protein
MMDLGMITINTLVLMKLHVRNLIGRSQEILSLHFAVGG